MHMSLQFESPSMTIMPRSLPTHSFATSSPSAVPSTASKMLPCIIPLMHSYSRDMAEVSRMILVSGGRSFFISRGSRGVSVANCLSQPYSAPQASLKPTSLMSLMAIQLLLPSTSRSNRRGASLVVSSIPIRIRRLRWRRSHWGSLGRPAGAP
jgi:hypothetical protein